MPRRAAPTDTTVASAETSLECRDGLSWVPLTARLTTSFTHRLNSRTPTTAAPTPHTQLRRNQTHYQTQPNLIPRLNRPLGTARITGCYTPKKRATQTSCQTWNSS